MCREVGESEGAEERSRRKVSVAVQRQETMGNRKHRGRGVEWLEVLQSSEEKASCRCAEAGECGGAEERS